MAPSPTNAMETGCQYHLTIGFGFGFGFGDAHWLQVEIISRRQEEGGSYHVGVGQYEHAAPKMSPANGHNDFEF